MRCSVCRMLSTCNFTLYVSLCPNRASLAGKLLCQDCDGTQRGPPESQPDCQRLRAATEGQREDGETARVA